MLPQQRTLYSMIFIAILTALCTILAIILIYQLCSSSCTREQRQQQTFRINLFSKLLLLSCVLVSTSCDWADVTRHIICYVHDKGLYYYPLNNIMCFADFLYYLGAILFYTIAISRLQVTFNGTQYAISKFVATFFYSLIGMKL